MQHPIPKWDENGWKCVIHGISASHLVKKLPQACKWDGTYIPYGDWIYHRKEWIILRQVIHRWSPTPHNQMAYRHGSFFYSLFCMETTTIKLQNMFWYMGKKPMIYSLETLLGGGSSHGTIPSVSPIVRSSYQHFYAHESAKFSPEVPTSEGSWWTGFQAPLNCN